MFHFYVQFSEMFTLSELVYVKLIIQLAI